MKMNLTRWLWALWGVMLVSMVLRQKADTYMILGLTVLPLLIVLLNLHEEITSLKDENKHQRKFVLDRYNALQERLNDMSSQIEKRLVVDFSEFAQSNSFSESAQMPRESKTAYEPEKPKKSRGSKKKKKTSSIKKQMIADFAALSLEEPEEDTAADAPKKAAQSNAETEAEAEAKPEPKPEPEPKAEAKAKDKPTTVDEG